MDEDAAPRGFSDLQRAVAGLLDPATVLDILANFTLFATDQKKRRLKIVCRFQQYEGANRIVARVVAGYPKKGLIWHFQGSGKSLLMVLAAQKLRLHPALKNPAVLIVVDRLDLDTQISATFHASDIPNLVKAETRKELKRLLRQNTRKIIIAFLKELLELARELVAAEKETPPEEDENRGKAALTELFQEARNPETPVVVERVVNDIDEIVRLVRFPGWQQTSAGEREVKKALRKALFKYKLHSDLELFEKAYGYVRQYY